MLPHYYIYFFNLANKIIRYFIPDQILIDSEDSAINANNGNHKDKNLKEIIYYHKYTETSDNQNNNDNFNINNVSNSQKKTELTIKAKITVKLLKQGNITTLDSIEISKEKNYLTNTQYLMKLHAYEQFRIKYYEKIKKNKIIILSIEKYLKK